MDETEEYCGLPIDQHAPVVVVATSNVAVYYRESVVSCHYSVHLVTTLSAKQLQSLNLRIHSFRIG